MAKTVSDEKMLTALLKNHTVRAAAAECKLSEDTLYRRLKDSGFLGRLHEARRELFASSVGHLQLLAGDAVDTLRRNLNCGSPGVEVRAALGIIDNALKGSEVFERMEMINKIEELEDEGTFMRWVAFVRQQKGDRKEMADAIRFASQYGTAETREIEAKKIEDLSEEPGSDVPKIQ